TPAPSPFPTPAHLAGQSPTRVLAEPSSTAVGLALKINAGSGWETQDEDGLSLLAGLALLEELRPQLARLGVMGAVARERNALTVTALLPRTTWQASDGLLLYAFCQPAPGAEAVERARASLLRTPAMEEGNPAHDLCHALQQAHFGRTS